MRAHEESSELGWSLFVSQSRLFRYFLIVWIRIWNTDPDPHKVAESILDLDPQHWK